MTAGGQHSRAGPGRNQPEFEELAQRVDDAVRRIKTLDGAAKQIAEEVKAAVEAVHRAGLVTIVQRMRQDERARDLLFELVDDPVIRLLLSLHGIIRPTTATEANRSTSPTLIPLEAIPPGSGRIDASWVRTSSVEEVPDGEITLLELTAPGGSSTEVIVVRLGGLLSAYVNACAHQGLPLEAALLDTEAETLTCPWHGYCFDAVSGRCMSAPGAQLERLPVRVDDGHVWIRVGT